MNEIVRFYEIMPADTQQIRGWQGHQLEKKWFYCLHGSFIINIVKVDNFENPTKELEPTQYIITDAKPQVLFVPEGHATAFKAIEENARVQVFSNFDVNTSINDDFRFPITQWETNWNM